MDSHGVAGNALTSRIALNPDASRVAFSSLSANLVPNDGNGVSEVFVRDRSASTTERDSIGVQ